MTPGDGLDTAIPVTAEEFHGRRRRIIYISLGAALVLAMVSYFLYHHYMDPINAREAYDDAKRLAAITRYGQSVLAAGRAIQLKPDFGDAYFLRAQAYAAERELEAAESDYAKLIRLEPQRARGYLGRCEVRYDFKDYKSAIEDCSKAIEFDASNSRALNLRGASRRMLNDLPRSLADLDKAVTVAANIDNLYQRAATLRAMGQYKRAIADFDEAVLLFPGNPEVYRARAEAKRAAGDEQGALEDYRTGKGIEGR